MSNNGKGSIRRPACVSKEVFDKNYERIFGKIEKTTKEENNENDK